MEAVKIRRKLILACLMSLSLILSLSIGEVFAATGNQSNTTTNTSVKANFTIKEICNASSRVNNLSDTYNIVPNYVEIYSNQTDYQITLPQFIQLLTDGLLKVNAGSKTSVVLKNVSYPSAPVNNFKAGVIYKTEYLDLATKIKSFIATNGRVPNYVTTSLGTMRYEPAVAMFSKIMVYYDLNKRLPNYVTMKAWNTKRPVYIVSDNILGNQSDTNRVNAIVSQLKSLGIPAYACGIGPQCHLTVLGNATVPQNALVVEIAGGADAAAIAEKAGAWYKNLKGDRKVFDLFLSTATRITGLDWLPRSWDDNYSPSSFKGVARPDLVLLNNGYDYIEGITPSDVKSMVYFILKETMT